MKLTKKVLKHWLEVAESEKKSGAKVEINYNLPYVAITRQRYAGEPDEEFFFQGEEADTLISECPDNISVEDYLLNISGGW